MRVRRLALLGLAGVLLMCDTGCRFRRWRDPYANYYRNTPPGGRPDYSQPPIPANMPPLPPGAVPGAATPMPGAPGGPEVLTPQPAPPGGLGTIPNQSGYTPPPMGLRPADHLAIPGPGAGFSTKEPPLARSTPWTPPKVNLLPPDLLEPRVTDNANNIPPGANADTSPSLPVGIVAFFETKDKIATGRRPETEGLDWLRAHKYQTIIHLRRPGVDDSADREQVEKRGLKYVSLEISPTTLTKEVIEQFNKALAEKGNLPLFVYDKDGTLAGAMWYLHFRTADKMPDDLARVKAELYGLKLEGDDEVKSLWAAIQLLIGND